MAGTPTNASSSSSSGYVDPYNSQTATGLASPYFNILNLFNNGPSESPYHLQKNIDPNSLFSPQEEGGLADPFGPSYGTPGVANEQSSPGYQAYGQDWVNLVSALTDPGILQSSSAANAGQSAITEGISSGFNPNEFLGPAFSNNKDPFTLSNGGKGYETALNDIKSGNDSSYTYSQVEPYVTSALGLEAGSPEAQNYTNAFITYVNAQSDRNQTVDTLNASKRSGTFEDILGKIVGGAAWGLAGGGAESLATGGLEGLTSGLTDFGSSSDLKLYDAIRAGQSGATALAGGNPIGAVTSGLSAGSGIGGDVGQSFGLAGTGVNLGNNIASGDLAGITGGVINAANQANDVFGDNTNPMTGTSGNNVSGSNSGFDPMSGANTNSGDNISGSPVDNPAGGSLGSAAGSYYNSLTGGNLGTAAGNTYNNISGTNGASNVSGQAQASALSEGLNDAKGVDQLSNLLNGIVGGNNPQGPQTPSFGTNIIQTPVTGAEASSINQTGSWTDRQLYDFKQALDGEVSAGKITPAQAQQRLQQVIQQQTQ